VDTAIRFLKSHCVEGQRGNRNFWIDKNDKNSSISIEKISLQCVEYFQPAVGQDKAMPYNYSLFSDIHNLCISRWENLIYVLK